MNEYKKPKPRAEAWITKNTAWFVLTRRARNHAVAGINPGDWTSVTRTHSVSKVSAASCARMRRVIAKMKEAQNV